MENPKRENRQKVANIYQRLTIPKERMKIKKTYLLMPL
tara:strand:+ start:4901 stop:5014 length:114 start_codon:yes stop_codon:yes gene_type:complete